MEEVPAPEGIEECRWEADCPVQDDFDGDSLNIHFQTLRIPLGEDVLSLKDRPGHLRLYGHHSLASTFTQAHVDSGVDLVSRSVENANSYQEYHSVIKGNCRCTGHSECDAILADNGRVNAAPELYAGNIDASLIHEAAIGKIAGEQIIKLRTLGLTEEEAEQKIIDGFLK